MGAALLGVCVGAGAPAQALMPKPPTPKESAQAYERMLAPEDPPKELLVSDGIEYTTKYHPGQHQALCDKNGVSVEGRETNLLFQVELGETNSLKDPVALEQKVWPYRNSTEALREWQYIEQQVKLCTGRSQWKGETGENVQYLSNGRTKDMIQGRTGIWIWIDARKGSFNVESEDGGYYVLYLVGDTIQSVEYDYPDAKGLSQGLKDMVNRLAWVLGNRWLAAAT